MKDAGEYTQGYTPQEPTLFSQVYLLDICHFLLLYEVKTSQWMDLRIISAGRPVETTDSGGPGFCLLLEKPCMALSAMQSERIIAVHYGSREAVKYPSPG